MIIIIIVLSFTATLLSFSLLPLSLLDKDGGRVPWHVWGVDSWLVCLFNGHYNHVTFNQSECAFTEHLLYVLTLQGGLFQQNPESI